MYLLNLEKIFPVRVPGLISFKTEGNVEPWKSCFNKRKFAYPELESGPIVTSNSWELSDILSLSRNDFGLLYVDGSVYLYPLTTEKSDERR